MTSRSQPSLWRLSFRDWLSLLLLGLALWLIVTFASLLIEVLWVLFGALLISLAIRPVADVLAHWRIPRAVTVLGAYAFLGLILALVGSLLAPAVSDEVASLQSGGPALVQQAMSQIAATPLLGRLVPSTDVLAQNLIQQVDVVLRTALGAVASLGSLALDVLAMLVLAFFLSSDPNLGERLLSRWWPGQYESEVRVVWMRVQPRLTRWIWAQLGVASYFAVVFSVGLALLGVPFALTIGLTGGVLEVVPYLGGVVAVVLAVVSALTVHPSLALWVVVYYLVVTEVESHVIAPTLFGRVIGMHPAAILVALLIGAKAGGIAGVLFAVPLFVVLAAVLQELLMFWKAPTGQPELEGLQASEVAEDGTRAED